MSDKIERIIDALRKKILESAIRGELVPQNPEDEPAYKLLERIAEERERLIKEKKIKKPKSSSCIFRRDGHFYESINDGKPTCIDDDIPFEIPDSWEWVRAGSIFEIWSAKRVHQSDWQNEGVPFFRTREIVKLAETGTVENDLFISSDLFHKLSVGGLPHAGDLMITAVGTIGKVYIVRQEDRFYFKDASVISFRNYGGLEPYFLKSLISSSCVQNQIFSKSAGTTVDTITIVKANDYLLPIPPIEEQKRINKALTQREQQLIAILNSRKRYRRILSETPTSLRQQLIQAAIQGLLVPQNPHDEPARLLLERIAQERTAKLGKKAAKSMSRIERRGSKTYELFPDGTEKDISDEIPFEIPSSWAWVRLGNLCIKIGAGSTPKGGKAVYKENGILFLRSQNVYNNGLRLEKVAFIEPAVDESMAGSRVEPLDLLLNITGASIGRCAIVPPEIRRANVNQHVLILRCIDKSMDGFVHACIVAPFTFKHIMSLQVGATKEGLSAQNASRLLLPIPPYAEQQRIVTTLNTALAYIAL